MTALIVLAKEPVPGAVKTRLCPPCTPAEAARLAAAALADTLDAVIAARTATRRVLVLEGQPGPWVPPGIDVVAQRGEGLAGRLSAAFADVGGPALLVGMDTPQLTAADLDRGIAVLGGPGVDAVLGPARDGGYWAVGLATADEERARQVFHGIPMSTAATYEHQVARFRDLGLQVGTLPERRDVDTLDDLAAVGAAAPDTRFGRLVAGMGIATGSR